MRLDLSSKCLFGPSDALNRVESLNRLHVSLLKRVAGNGKEDTTPTSDIRFVLAIICV